MKKIISLILAVIAIAVTLNGQEPTGDNNYTPITLETGTKGNDDGSGRHRAPMHIGLEAYYNSAAQSIEIYYYGDGVGEVFLYLNDVVVGYDDSINTSFKVSAHGFYMIEVVGETWSAKGYIEL